LRAAALAVLAFVALAGCASTSDWSVSEARTCAPKAPPRVCVLGEPDHGHVVELADVELLPGECAVAGDEGRGGLLRVETRDRERARRGRWVSTRKGKATILKVRADGKLRASRRRCQREPISLEP
jgi:hypothetical protein